jgi:hypothetical protein
MQFKATSLFALIAMPILGALAQDDASVRLSRRITISQW